MIDIYYGEFTINPIPLELSLGACSNRCYYCFANLNYPNRKTRTEEIRHQLDSIFRYKTFVSSLIRAGYPVCVSNRSDAFANNNIKAALPILESMTKKDIPITFQTKGGAGVKAALGFLKPAVWYVTVEMTEETRRKVCPHAPTIQARLETIELLVRHGHHVVMAINPCVPEWLPDPVQLVEWARRAGVWGVWVERLHLSKTQVGKLKTHERAAIGEPIIERAMKKGHPKEQEHFKLVRNAVIAGGLEVYSMGQPNHSNFWNVYRQVYPVTFPVLQDWINNLAASSSIDDLVSFDAFANFFCSRLPGGDLPIQGYYGATSRGLWARYPDIPKIMTYRKMLSYAWRDPWTKYSLVQSPAFAYAALWDDKDPPGWVQLTDDDGMPYMVYNKAGFADFYHCMGAL